MQHELILMRHAKSDWSDATLSDLDRPLKKRGRRAAKRIAHYLVDSGRIPDRIISSSAARALETANIIARIVSAYINRKDADNIIVLEELYLAPAHSILKLICGFSDDWQRVILVAHNPGLEELVLKLSTPDRAGWNEKLFPTASIAAFRVEGRWKDLAASNTHLELLLRPAEVSDF